MVGVVAALLPAVEPEDRIEEAFTILRYRILPEDIVTTWKNCCYLSVHYEPRVARILVGARAA